ncbi:MAG: T9SS type A sorting domain-containing protein [Lewinellaceae bacterium]|nr:T9SS type A sorting domain-containing protein [Lewinellaceae bacterium]
MKTLFTSVFFATALCLQAQPVVMLDTLINQTFETDPTDDMLPFPTGNDLEWVNYDEDHLAGICVSPGFTPFGWWQEGDFGEESSDNDAFTSCSYLVDPGVRNANWLITSPVLIPDSSYWLCWRSLSYYGPGYLDGYQVLVSTTTNDPTDHPFTDTLFTAAEMVEDSQPTGSLDVDDYVFSNGYIHANGFTDTSYFFVDYSEGPPFFHGTFEPHAVSLAAYSGKTIYVAFLHDSRNNFMLQVDDILVSKTAPHGVPTYNRPDEISYLNVFPNPVKNAAYISWKAKTPSASRIIISDCTGKTVLEKTFGSREEGNCFVEMQHLEAGLYYCTLFTAYGRASAKFVKQ